MPWVCLAVLRANGRDWHVAMQPCKLKEQDRTKRWDRLFDEAQRLKASVRTAVDHPFDVVTNLFHLFKVDCNGLSTNEAQLFTLFGLANLVIAKR